MSLPVPDPAASVAALEDVVGRFTALLRTADPSRNAIGKWSTAELATHVSMIFTIYPGLARGEGGPIKDHLATAAYWDEALAEDPLRDPAGAADRIEAGLKEFLALVGLENWEQRVPWYGGTDVPVHTLVSVLTNECTIHGRDVAAAEAKPWTISKDTANLIFDGHLPLLAHFVDHEAIDGLDASYRLHLRGGSTIYFEIAGGKMTMSEAPSRSVDCRISADPVTYLLVGYGRTSQWLPILTGKIVAYGKKPWLGLRFASLFHSA